MVDTLKPDSLYNTKGSKQENFALTCHVENQRFAKVDLENHAIRANISLAIFLLRAFYVL